MWWSPEYTDPHTGKYMGRQPWEQTKLYFLRTTTGNDNVPEVLDLQEHVAIAYPSDACNQLFNVKKTTTGGLTYSNAVYAYVDDVRQPTLVMKDDDVKYAFKCDGYNTSLVWYLEPLSGGEKQTQANKFVSTMNGNGLNMTPANPFSNVVGDKQYRLRLVYFKVKADNILEREETDLLNLTVNAKDGSWRTGGYWTQKKHNVVTKTNGPEYEKPFVGMRLESMEYAYGHSDDNSWTIDLGNTGNASVLYNYMTVNQWPLRLCDPYFYFAYLGRWAFIGGRESHPYLYDGLGNQSTEAFVYTDRGGSWAGDLLPSSANVPMRILETDLQQMGYERLLTTAWHNIRNLTVYDKRQWSKYTNYPLPVFNDADHVHIEQAGPDMTPRFNYATDDKEQILNLLLQIWGPYALANELAIDIPKYGGFYGLNDLEKNKKNYNNMALKNEAVRSLSMGSYTPDYGNGLTRGMVRIPHYQFYYLAGGTLNKSHNVYKKATLYKSFLNSYSGGDGIGLMGERVYREQDELVWYRLFLNGATPTTRLRSTGAMPYDLSKVYAPNGTIVADQFDARLAGKNVKSIVVSCYRVDAYDMQSGKYGVTDASKVKTITVKNPFDYAWWNKYYNEMKK